MIVDGPSRGGSCPPRPLTDPTVRNYRSGFVRHDSRSWPGVRDARAQQGIARKDTIEARPRKAPSPRPACQPPTPDAAHRMDELLQTAIVRRTAVVLVVAPQFRVEHLLLGFQWRVQMLSTPRGDSDQPAPQAFLHRAHVHREFASPASGTPVRKAQEVESGGLGLRPFRLTVGTAAEFYQASLLRMKRQTVLRKPL